MAGLVEHHRFHHHGGVTLFIAMSLDTLGVSAEQRAAVEKIRRDLHAHLEPAHVAEQNVLDTLADGLSSANVDTAKVDAAVAQLTSAATAVQDASADALNALHGVLTPPQRAALVEKVESHWAVWRQANAEEWPGERPGRDRLDVLAADIDLAPEQVAKIRAGLGDGQGAISRADPQELATSLHAFGDAFQREGFDAKTLATANLANGHVVGSVAAGLARLVEVAAPVLTPDQRARLADRLREHANHNPSAQGAP